MNIRPPFIAHHEWQDSLADWAEQQHMDRERLAYLTADYTPAERRQSAELGWIAPQGRTELVTDRRLASLQSVHRWAADF